MDYLEKYKLWCTDSYFDYDTRTELLAIAADDKEIQERFYKELEFGTGGLRGKIGAGSNRMNIYTVRKATQGLANCILKKNVENKRVAIAYDSRKMSSEFAEETALCLNANGIESYKFDSLRPTPELSFAVRKLGCIAGVVITASHNPSEYNGYKVYWEDGGQITAPLDNEIINEVNSINDYHTVKMIDREQAECKGLYHIMSEEIDDAYIATIKQYLFNQNITRKIASDIKIVYTPLHGTGNLLVRRILREIGFLNVFTVPEQDLPNSKFPTVLYPNPEDPKAFALALEYANKLDADIVIATDPDADRLGIYVKKEKGSYVPFTGNMSGLLIAEYILSQKSKRGTLSSNGALVSTIVTSDMAKAIAKEYEINFIETLTGFKYIGEQIKRFEAEATFEYLFGFEESFGCLIGTYARDKDAVSAAMILCEAAAYYKSKGITLWEQINRLYEKYGYYKEELITMTFEGIEGKNKIDELIGKYRLNPADKIGHFTVKRIRDYMNHQIKDQMNGEIIGTGLPTSNVIYYELSDGGWFCVRPSGTEPKIKFYISTVGNTMEEAEKYLVEIKDVLLNEGN